jgi:hypothetical protein
MPLSFDVDCTLPLHADKATKRSLCLSGSVSELMRKAEVCGQRFQGVRPPGTKADRILWAIRRPPTIARRMDDDDFDELFTETNNGITRRQRVRDNLLDAYHARQWRQLFTAARMAGLSIAFCGPTGSGRTDLARRARGVSRPDSRMVTIETDDEYGDVGPENKAPLFYDDTQISSDEAVRIALRLVPVEIALQEVRGAEAYSLLRAVNSGHSGVTTWHAMEGSELDALCMMARQHPAGREMTEDRLMAMARDAFDVIAYCYREGNNFRVSSVRLMANGTGDCVMLTRSWGSWCLVLGGLWIALDKIGRSACGVGNQDWIMPDSEAVVCHALIEGSFAPVIEAFALVLLALGVWIVIGDRRA